ncbi:MAG: electron transport complex subunit RsxC [Spirochaetales bacterium]|jgi:electron transport complex protein RnfC|nr:electron transport complex subunit RsxC [Spirochaetales bacterium]
MSGIKTFPKGGLHPPGRKALCSSVEIKNAVIPPVLTVPLQQHLGKPALPLVEPGMEVREGMLIGRADGFISANVHSPVPGRVKSLKAVFLPNGLQTQAVEIEFFGEFDRSGRRTEGRKWEDLGAEELLKIVEDQGIVGMGGATFPAHAKFKVPQGTRIEYLVINGVECEPYLCSDHRLMLEKPREIIRGIRILRTIIQPEKIAIGVELNKADAIEALRKAAEAEGLPLAVVPLKVKYPQGDEKQLLKAVTRREVPSGALPSAIGAVVSNVGTVFAVYEAVALDKPLIERVVTVSGGAIAAPANLKVRIGTPIRSLIEECGGFREPPVKLVAGGPMMGFTFYDPETPVTKGTSGILALTKQEAAAAPRTFCLQCGKCIAVCPMGLNPTGLFKLIDHSGYARAVEGGLLDCKECGACAFACPAHIPLVQGFKLGKLMSRKEL